MNIKGVVKSSIGISLIISSTMLSALAAEKKVLHVGSWLPPKHTVNSVVLPTWAKWVEEATEGRVSVKVEYPGGHPKALFDLVQDGVYEAGWSFHGYLPGRFKLTKAVELPGLNAGSEAASVAHWRVHQKYFAKADEHKGVTVAGLFTHGPGQVHLREPVKTLGDLNGRKIRIGGGIQTDIAKRLGVEGVSVPGSEVYQMLAQGITDGVFMTMSDKRSLRLKEVAPFTLKFPKGMYLGSFSFFLNSDFIASLDEKDRKAIMSVSGEKFSAMAGKAWADADVGGEKDALAANNTIMDVDEKMLAEFVGLTSDIESEWLESVKAVDVDAESALKELREIARSY